MALVPFETAAFGSLTAPLVIGSGFADGFNPCAFALLVLFATYTLTLVNAVTADGRPTNAARRTHLGAGSLYVGAVWLTYFLIGIALFGFLSWLGRDHLVARGASVLALVMGLWMLKDVFLPGIGPALIAVLNASGGGPVGLALLALYNLAFIAPLVLLLLFVSNKRVLGTLGRWNRTNGGAVKGVLAIGVIVMSFGLLLSLGM